MGGVSKTFGDEDEMLFSKWMRMLLIGCALAKRYFQDALRSGRLQVREKAAQQPASPASESFGEPGIQVA